MYTNANGSKAAAAVKIETTENNNNIKANKVITVIAKTTVQTKHHHKSEIQHIQREKENIYRREINQNTEEESQISCLK